MDAPPALTVNPLALVILPVPVVAIFPLVARLPSSEMVNFETPPDWISRTVPVVPDAASLRTNALLSLH